MIKDKNTTISALISIFILTFGYLVIIFSATPVFAAGGPVQVVPQASAPAVQADPTCMPPSSGFSLAIPAPCTPAACNDSTPQGQNTCLKSNPITLWLVFFINLVTVLIVIGASTMIAYAGIQYITAADNAQKVQAAKDRIRDVVIGLVAFFFLFAFLQWLIPGGAL